MLVYCLLWLGLLLAAAGTAANQLWISVAGLLLGNELGELHIPRDRLLDYALMIERHPDNVTAALIGGASAVTAAALARSAGAQRRTSELVETRDGGPRAHVIGYAVGTQGAADRCAPSRTLSTGEQYEGVGISALLGRGHTVVVTDYEGLGTPGAHTYMVRESQAHAVLDSVRAAAQVDGAEVTASSPVALAGYSQGGGAAAAAAELAPDYAPELDLKGAYAGAPPADLVQVAGRIDGGLYAAFLLYAMAGQLAAYDVDPATHLNETGLTALAGAAETCMVGSLAYAHLDSATLTHTGQDFPELVRSDAELAGILAEQKLGAEGRRPEVPVMIAHSLTDDVIPYRTGRELGLRWCAEGARVRFDPVLTPTHMGGYVAALPRMHSFLDAALADRWTPNSCGWF